MAGKKVKNLWFDKRRPLFLAKMVKEFHATMVCFQTLYESYLHHEKIPFAEVEKLVGSETDKGYLWRLKDRCHQLWRDAEPRQDMLGCLFDWLVGSSFHEAMKLKENCYVYQFYNPLAAEIGREGLPGSLRFCGAEYQRFMARTVVEMARELEQLGFMFGRANFLLRTMLPSHGDNPLLLRLLVENPGLPDQLWFESLDDLFAGMFGSAEEGYCRAARSYAQGQWHEKARQAYRLALKANDRCFEAENFLGR